jgi:hypothetical protein
MEALCFPNQTVWCFEFWSLELIWNLVLGIWCLCIFVLPSTLSRDDLPDEAQGYR